MPKLSRALSVVVLALPLLLRAVPALADDTAGTLSGTFETASHRPVPKAEVILVGSNGQGIFHATTDSRGHFSFAHLPLGTYELGTESTTYYAQRESIVVSAQPQQVALEAIRTIAVTSVSAPRRLAPSKSELAHSSQTQVVLDKNVIAAQAPLAGSEQLLAAAPGITQASYGSTGAAKSMISMRGFKQGWANQNGIVDNGLFGVRLNGVYLNNPQTGIWEPDEIPDLSIISGARVTYGPGDAATRTFDSLGGTVDFYTILPSHSSTVRASVTAGSYGGEGYHLDFSRSLSSHWGVLLAQGRTFSQGFRDIYGSGYTAPGSTYGTFAEAQDLFTKGSLLFFAYSADGTEYRPNLVPVTPLQGPNGSVVTVNGFDSNGNPIAGPAYSQATTGFYSALPASVWQKTDSNATRLAAVDLTYSTGYGSYVTNQLWYRRGNRVHVKDFNFDQSQNTSRYELNNPYSTAVGDSFAYHVDHGPHSLAFGTDLLFSHYETRNDFYATPSTITLPSNYRNDDFWMSNLAFFAQDTMRLAPTTTFEASIRSVALNTSFVNNGTVAFPDCADPASPCFGNNHTDQPNSTTSYHQFEPAFSLHQVLTRDLSLYASFGHAIRDPQASPGGPYERVSVIGLLPETTDDTEGGFKFYHRMLGRNLDGSSREDFATLGLYQSSLNNENIPITTGQGLKVSSASGAQRFSGLTFAFNADIAPALQAFGGFAITHAIFSNYTLPGGPSYTGLPVTQTPTDTANLGLVASARVGHGIGTARVWDQYVGSSVMWDNSGLVNGYQGPSLTNQMIPSYNLVNGSLGYRFGDKRNPIGLTISATNLLNRKYNVFEYITSGAYFAGGPGQSINYGAGQVVADPGPPREVQVTLSFGE